MLKSRQVGGAMLRLVIALFFISTTGQAGVGFQTGLIAVHTQFDDGVTKSTLTRSYASTRLGYTFGPLFVGAHWLLSVNSVGPEDLGHSIGPQLGLVWGGLELGGSYLVFSNLKRGDAGTYQGTGYAFHVGYGWNWKGGFRVGLQLAYWANRFTEFGGTDLGTPYRENTFTPFFTLGWLL